MPTEQITRDLLETLREFSMPEDLIPNRNPGIYALQEKGMYRMCFRRGNFDPKNPNRISKALQNYELGDNGPLGEITEEIRREAEITLELDEEALDGKYKRLIKAIILIARKEILEALLTQNCQ